MHTPEPQSKTKESSGRFFCSSHPTSTKTLIICWTRRRFGGIPEPTKMIRISSASSGFCVPHGTMGSNSSRSSKYEYFAFSIPFG